MKRNEIRCPRCGRLLGYIDGRAEIKCSKCKSIVEAETTDERPPIVKIKSVTAVDN